MTTIDTSAEAVTRLRAAIDDIANGRSCRLEPADLCVVLHEAESAKKLRAERDAARAELSAHKAVHDIGEPKEGYREMVWRDAQAFYENEDARLREIAEQRDAALAKAVRLREALENAVDILDGIHKDVDTCAWLSDVQTDSGVSPLASLHAALAQEGGA